jgi:hypothetical protein
MSIRNLTTQVHRENTEHQRVQQFQSVRSASNAPETKQSVVKQTPFLVGTGNRKERVPDPSADLTVPPPTATPKIGLKERASQTTYGIPGGIVARFGREALKQTTTQAENKTTPEPVRAELPAEENTKEADELELLQVPEEQERVTEEEATRITIELQSH